MIFKYGSYSHANNEVELTVRQRPVYSPRGIRQATRAVFQLEGVLQAASQQALTTVINALASAYATDGKDAGLYLDNGSTRTAHFLDSSAAIGGVRVVSLNFPEGRGAEYSTFRTYAITLEADFPTGNSELLAFEETIRFQGTGGPRFVYLHTLNGPPQRQIVAAQTTQRITQVGRAVGFSRSPAPPPPIWPEAEHVDARRIARQSPVMRAGTPSEYAVSWSYVFESAVPRAGNPRAL